MKKMLLVVAVLGVGALAWGEAASRPATGRAARVTSANGVEQAVAMVTGKDAQRRKAGFEMMMADVAGKEGVSAATMTRYMAALRQAKMRQEARGLLDEIAKADPGKNGNLAAAVAGYRALLLLDEGNKADALKAMQAVVHENPKAVQSVIVVQKWVDALASAGLAEEAPPMLDELTLAVLTDVKAMEKLQALKVRALLAAGRNEEALSAGKCLYGVSSMAGTADAIRLMVQCLRAVYPEDSAKADQFQAEQVAGVNAAAALVPGAATTQPVMISALMKGIVVDGKAYEEKVKAARLQLALEKHFTPLMQNGNLLLLAGKPDEAKNWFEQAYQIADEERLAEAVEGLARVMKAQDGTVARANAYLLSLRKKDGVAGK